MLDAESPTSCAGSRGGVDRDRALMIADDPLDDGESQAAALGLGGEAGDEQMRALLGIDPGTLIGDRELQQVTVDSGRDRDARGFGAQGAADRSRG